MVESGAVVWQFELRGAIGILAEDVDTDEVQLMAIEAGALDVFAEDGEVNVITEPGSLESVREVLVAAGMHVTRSEIARLPKNVVRTDENAATQTLRLLEVLDDLDDVSNVYSNADFPAEVVETVSAS
jgi:transcriptional/translational regulatory protein YebC/TACO1